MSLDSREDHGNPPNSGSSPLTGARNLVGEPYLHQPLLADTHPNGREQLSLGPPIVYPAYAPIAKVGPLWENGFHNWAQILGRAPHGRPYFLEDRNLT